MGSLLLSQNGKAIGRCKVKLVFQTQIVTNYSRLLLDDLLYTIEWVPFGCQGLLFSQYIRHFLSWNFWQFCNCMSDDRVSWVQLCTLGIPTNDKLCYLLSVVFGMSYLVRYNRFNIQIIVIVMWCPLDMQNYWFQSVYSHFVLGFL